MFVNRKTPGGSIRKMKYALLGAAAVLAAAQYASATTIYEWTGTAAAAWETNNWNNGTAGQPWADNVNNIAQFDSGGTANTVTVASSTTHTLGGINFVTTGWTVTGSATTSKLTTGGATPFLINLTGSTSNILGVAIGSTSTGGVTITGGGTLTVNGGWANAINAFTGQLTVTGGATLITANALNYGAVSDDIVLNNGTLSTGSTQTIASTHTVRLGSNDTNNGNGTVVLTSTSKTLTIAGNIVDNNTGGGATDTLTYSGGALSDVLVLTGTNSYTGGTLLNGSGALNFTTLSNLGSGNVAFGGGTLQWAAAASTADVSARLANTSSALKFDVNNNAVVFANVLGSGFTGGLTLTSTTAGGSLTLTGLQAYSGLTTVTSGTLKLAASSNLASGATLTTASGGTFDLNGNNQVLGQLVNPGTVTNSSATSVNLSFNGGSTGTISGKMNVTLNQISGSGVVIAGSTNVGDVTINATAGGTVTWTAANNTGQLFNTGNTSSNTTITTLGTGLTGITEGGTSKLIIAGANATFTGTTTINAGILSFVTTGLGTSGGITFGGGTLQWAAAANTQDVSGRFADTSSTLKLDVNNNAVVFANPIGAGKTGGLTITSSTAGGSLTLTGSNLYTGLTTIGTSTANTGKLILAAAGGTLASGNALTTLGGGTFDVAGNAQTLGTATNGGTITNSGSATTLTIGDGSTGGGTYTGALNVIWNQGASSTTISGGFSNTGSLTFNATGAGTIAASGPINIGGAIVNSGGGSGQTTISGAVTGTSGLTENSANSTITLTGPNTFTSGATLQLGTLLLQTTGGTVITSGVIVTSPIGTGLFHLGSGTNAVNLQTSNTTTHGLSNNISLDGDVTFSAVTASGRISLDVLGINGGNQLTTPNTITLTRTNQLTTNSGVTLDLIGVIAGSTFGITKLGPGTLNIGSNTAPDAVANTYNGLTEISAGSVTLNKTAGTDAIAGNLQIDGTGTLTLGANNENIKNTSNLTVNTGGALAMNGRTETIGSLVLGGGTISTTSGNLIIAGAGSASITSGSISSLLTLGTGGLSITPSGAANATVSGGVNSTSPASNVTITNSGSGTVTLSSVAINNQGTITNNGSSSNTTLLSAPIGVNVTGIVENGASPLSVTGTVSVGAGGLTLTQTSGTLAVTGGLLTNNAGGTLDLNGNNASFSNVSGTTTPGNITNSGTSASVLTLNLSANGTTAYAGTFSDSGPGRTLSLTFNLTNATTGDALDLTGATFNNTGDTTFTGVGVNVVNIGSKTLPGTLILAGGGIRGSSTNVLPNNVTLVNGATFTFGDTQSAAIPTLGGPINAQGIANFTFQNGRGTGNHPIILSGVISDTVSTDTLTFYSVQGATTSDNVTTTTTLAGAAANAYQGNIFVKGGMLILNKSNGGLPTNAIIGNVTVGDGVSNTLASNRVSTLQIGLAANGDQIQDTSVITLATATDTNGFAVGAFDLNSATETIGGLVGGGYVGSSSGTATLAVNTASATNTYSGVIGTTVPIQVNAAGTALTFSSTPRILNLVIGGGGTQVLAGTNTYTGNTTITDGHLVLASTGSIANSPLIIVGDTAAHSGATLDVSAISGGFHVLSGQTLAGHGSITGAITVDTGAHTAPGNTIGTTTYNTSLSYSGGTSLDYEFATPLAGHTFVAGSSDLISVTGGAGSLAFTGGPLSVTLNALSGAPVSGAGGSYELFSYTDPATVSSFAPGDGLTVGTILLGSGWDTVDFTYNITNDVANNGIFLDLTPSGVPEPASLALLGLGAAALLGRRRHRG